MKHQTSGDICDKDQHDRQAQANAAHATNPADRLMETGKLSAVMKLPTETTDGGKVEQVKLDGDTTVTALIQMWLNQALPAEAEVPDARFLAPW